MVKPVDRIVPDFAKAGANIISFHPEASRARRSHHRADHASTAARPGWCSIPATPLSYLDHTLDKLDLVLLMSVNPGFGGQKFIASVLPKIAEVRRRIAATRPRHLAGGRRRREGRQHRARSRAAGADTFVAGSAIFGAKDYAADHPRRCARALGRAIVAAS